MALTRIVKRNRTKRKITGQYPVVVVYRSNKHVIGQVYDPITGNTLYSASSHTITTGTKSDKAKQVGKKIAQKIKDLKLEKVVFSRNGFEYKGRIKAVADSIREENVNI